MDKKYRVFGAAKYPTGELRVMFRLQEAKSPAQAIKRALEKRKDHGYSFIVLQAPVCVWVEGSSYFSTYSVDLKKGEYVVRRKRRLGANLVERTIVSIPTRAA